MNSLVTEILRRYMRFVVQGVLWWTVASLVLLAGVGLYDFFLISYDHLSDAPVAIQEMVDQELTRIGVVQKVVCKVNAQATSHIGAARTYRGSYMVLSPAIVNECEVALQALTSPELSSADRAAHEQTIRFAKIGVRRGSVHFSCVPRPLVFSLMYVVLVLLCVLLYYTWLGNSARIGVLGVIVVLLAPKYIMQQAALADDRFVYAYAQQYSDLQFLQDVFFKQEATYRERHELSIFSCAANDAYIKLYDFFFSRTVEPFVGDRLAVVEEAMHAFTAREQEAVV